MANADHTARARPKVHFGPLSLSQQHTRHQASMLADVTRGTLAIVRVLAQGVAARRASQVQSPHRNWQLDEVTVDGLAAALKILSERAEALSRPDREGEDA